MTKNTLSLLAFVLFFVLFAGYALSEPNAEESQAVAPAVDYSKLPLAELKAAAEKGEVNAQCWLGRCYRSGLNGCERDETKAAELFQKVAKNTDENNPLVSYCRGNCYASGYGVWKDEKEAVKWFRKAAEQNDAFAQNNLANYYNNGAGGLDKNEKKARELYQKAVEQGLAVAQSQLGNCYYFGKGVDKDFTEAVRWFRKAAEQGNTNAQFSLGNAYCNGEGVDKDFTEAVKWYRKAAEQGDAPAQYNLGVMYHKGAGVDKDFTEAVKWYRKAAEQGDAVAQYNLGVCYLDSSRGGEISPQEGVKWLFKAAEQGHNEAQKRLNSLFAKKITPAESQKAAASQPPVRESSSWDDEPPSKKKTADEQAAELLGELLIKGMQQQRQPQPGTMEANRLMLERVTPSVCKICGADLPGKGPHVLYICPDCRREQRFRGN
ncbi:MAG: sel1 repeat family protein [Planctomycetaceae bacterium]|jgi:TPR repeat protein|nr:sel1 repeat family protein [Planctomycetaceae bacterium]